MALQYFKSHRGDWMSYRKSEAITGFTPEEIVSLLGISNISAINPHNFTKYQGKYPTLEVIFQVPGYYFSRLIDFEYKYISNLYWELKNSTIGKEILSKHIRAAKAVGFEKVFFAAIHNSENFDDNDLMRINHCGFEMIDEDFVLFQQLMKKHHRSEKNLDELLQSDEGELFWDNYGEPWTGVFDLTTEVTSQNWQKFNSYFGLS